MKRIATFLLMSLAVLALWGCGATVGDPCTTEADCGGQICLNRDATPGGYCTKQCTLTEASSCPGGTLCVRDAAGNDLAACLRECTSSKECRAGYVCRTSKDSVKTVCLGPED